MRREAQLRDMRSTTCASIRKRPSNNAIQRTPIGAAELHAAHHNNPTGVEGILGTRSVFGGAPTSNRFFASAFKIKMPSYVSWEGV